MTPPSSGITGRWWKLVTALCIAAYFFFVSRDGLRATFSADDMLAIYSYWRPLPLQFIARNFLLWRGFFRPMIGFFYLPIFARYGLDPRPYHVVLLLLLLTAAFLMYRFARALGCTETAAAIVAVIACYHVGMVNLYYNTVYVGDVLCGIFYFSAFALYARVRASGRLLNGRQMAAFLALYLCALNSKEMAVTLPVMLLVYEALYHPPPRWAWTDLVSWLRGPGLAICAAGVLDVLSVYGKTQGSQGLMHNPGYQPVFSWERIVAFQKTYLRDVFDQLYPIEGPWICAIWLVVTWLAWRRNRPLLRFCWFYVLIAPLPIEFLIGRCEANLYVTLPGWAIFAATLFSDALPSFARFLAAEPLFRRLDQAQRRLQPVLAAVFMILLAWHTWDYKEKWIVPSIPQLSPLTAQVLDQFRVVNPRVRPGSKVVFLEDPFSGYDMEFIAELWFRDRKVNVFLNQKNPLSSEELARADAVFTWRDSQLVRLH